MPSPFPGMNPYLEAEGVWQDFHMRLSTALSEVIADLVAPDYIVSLEEHLYVEEPPKQRGRFIGRSDVAVKEGPFWESGAGGLATATAVLEAPVYATQPEPLDSFAEPYLEIRDREENLVITVIELLSPTNKKTGPNRETYLSKRQQYLWSDVNFIEIDLLRGWGRMPLDEMPSCDYAVIVKRATQWPRVGVWPLKLKDPLPTIPVPLREPDPDARVDLQAVLNLVYDRAKYRYRVYSAKPRPPLMPEDARWAEAIVAEHLATDDRR